VNVLSGVRLSRQVLPGMKRRNWGRILFISSESGIQIPAEMIHYGMTKSAQIAIARGLAESVAGTGITVNSVLPGPDPFARRRGFRADAGDESGQSFDEFEKAFFEKVRPTSLIKRFATPEEVASMVVYLCSPLASATTGAAAARGWRHREKRVLTSVVVRRDRNRISRSPRSPNAVRVTCHARTRAGRILSGIFQQRGFLLEAIRESSSIQTLD
jgi:NAD(P)-dependent dehydrogenase (short-subunit alcohol dehydrogenase family)